MTWFLAVMLISVIVIPLTAGVVFVVLSHKVKIHIGLTVLTFSAVVITSAFFTALFWWECLDTFTVVLEVFEKLTPSEWVSLRPFNQQFCPAGLSFERNGSTQCIFLLKKIVIGPCG